jgi:hypothetical protein
MKDDDLKIKCPRCGEVIILVMKPIENTFDIDRIAYVPSKETFDIDRIVVDKNANKK